MTTTPLKGLKVLEFSHTIMGPCAGLILADLGAEVVKVEPAPAGDHTRRLPGFAAGFFATFNRNKRSIALDLKRAEGQAAAHRLVAGADVVLENYGPGTMERLGCGWESLATCDIERRLSQRGELGAGLPHRRVCDGRFCGHYRHYDGGVLHPEQRLRFCGQSRWWDNRFE